MLSSELQSVTVLTYAVVDGKLQKLYDLCDASLQNQWSLSIQPASILVLFAMYRSYSLIMWGLMLAAMPFFISAARNVELLPMWVVDPIWGIYR